jgi:hypothetical protein
LEGSIMDWYQEVKEKHKQHITATWNSWSYIYHGSISKRRNKKNGVFHERNKVWIYCSWPRTDMSKEQSTHIFRSRIWECSDYRVQDSTQKQSYSTEEFLCYSPH